MSLRAGIRREYSKHFTLDEGKLRRLCNVIREHSKNLGYGTYLQFYIEREKSAFYETRQIDEVLADDNAPGKAIRTLSIELHKEIADKQIAPDAEAKPIVNLVFYRFREEKVMFYVSGEDRDRCFLLAEELDSQVKRCLKKGRLLPIPKELIDIVVFFTIGAFVLLFLVYLSSRVTPELTSEEISAMNIEQKTGKILEMLSKKYSKSDYLVPIMWIVMAISMAIIGLKPLARILDKASRSVFYWGDMIAVHNAFEKKILRVKWGIVIAFVVSLVASIVTTLVVR
jgi:hypothetical protein